jgi:hypothetical protein
MTDWINRTRRFAFVALIWGLPCLAQTTSTDVQIDANNVVLYNYDTFDPSQFGTNPNATTVSMKTYNFHIRIGDITAVAGSPAKGTLVCRSVPMFVLSTNPAHGTQAMADTARNMVDDCSAEILTPDGVVVGTLFFGGLFGGAPPPGKIAGTASSNMIVSGGTGAFFGARGQAGTISFSPRVASVTEDPANRRINGGGKESLILQILPMFRPSVIMTQGGPAVVHSGDFSPVTAANPAKAGELLSVFASGLGPTNPAVSPGRPFPAGSAAPVNAPVQASLNGLPAEVLFAGGYPGAVDAYQVNIRVPAGIGSGAVTLVLTAGFIPGAAATIAVQ